MKHLAALTLAFALSVPAASAFADCSIFNDTGESFTVESGNVSNQRVGGHTHTSIASGRIKAVADSGKSVGGSCNDGDHMKIIDDHGVLVLVSE